MMTLILHSGYLLELVPGNFHMFVNFNLHSGCLLYCCIDDKKEPKKKDWSRAASGGHVWTGAPFDPHLSHRMPSAT